MFKFCLKQDNYFKCVNNKRRNYINIVAIYIMRVSNNYQTAQLTLFYDIHIR